MGEKDEPNPVWTLDEARDELFKAQADVRVARSAAEEGEARIAGARYALAHLGEEKL